MKRKALRLTLEFGTIIAVIITFVLINEGIIDNKRSSFKPLTNSQNYAYQVESININDSQLEIKGWFFELQNVRNIPNTVDKKKNIGILLYDVESVIEKDLDGYSKPRKGLALDVSAVKRKDVNDYFDCEYDYSDCGFVARIDISRLNYQNGIYQVVIKPEREDSEGLMINAFIVDGELKYINPKEEITLEVKNTDLEEIVTKGTCLVSDRERHICVYQYEMCLYWIAEQAYPFELNEKNFIQYILDTTQFDRLPESRKEIGWYWSDLGADFEEYEVTDLINCGKYRVCKRVIPTDFAITRIITGKYCEGDWIWKNEFRPDYINLMKNK